MASAQPEGKTKGDVLPGLVECLERLATDSTASIFNRFEAIELLLRLAMGPRHRPADSDDVDAGRHARVALSTAASFLDRTMKSNNDRARIRLHAASLASLVTKVFGRTALAGLNEFHAHKPAITPSGTAQRPRPSPLSA
jgi:hypothetical protein